MEWNLSHSEGTWLCDYTFQLKIYPILRRPDYVIKISSQKSIPFWGTLTMWLYFPAKNLSHSKETWLCDHNFQLKIYPILIGTDYVIIISSQKSIPLWGDLTMCYIFQSKIYRILRGPDYVIIISSQKYIPLWGDLTMWLYLNFQPKIYPILRGPDYVIVTYGMKSITFWEDLTMWLYFSVKNLSHYEGTWLCDDTMW